jgi:hypothetical protein
MSQLQNSQQTLKQKLNFTFLRDVSGADSLVKIVKIGETKFVLKTFKQKRILQNRMSPVAKRNREYYYQLELQNLKLPSLGFEYVDLVENDQLCMNYLENLQTFAEITDTEKFRTLGKFVQNLVEISQSQNTKLATEKGLETRDKGDHFDWLYNFVKNRSMESHFLELRLQIIEELRQKTEYLTLLHSDFNTNNISLVNGQILLFDSGECPYLFGHKYHDLTRLVMHEHGGIIFEKEDVSPNLSAFLESFEDFLDDPDFLKFCYIQSILIKNNTFIARRREICEYLFAKLS